MPCSRVLGLHAVGTFATQWGPSTIAYVYLYIPIDACFFPVLYIGSSALGLDCIGLSFGAHFNPESAMAR